MVISDARFIDELKQITDFIARQSGARCASAFKEQISSALKLAASSPLGCRKSRSFDDPQIRDCIFKGYVMPFRIEGADIRVLGIYKWNLW